MEQREREGVTYNKGPYVCFKAAWIHYHQLFLIKMKNEINHLMKNI